jgi:hypothetical protein
MDYPLLRIKFNLYPIKDKIKLILYRGSYTCKAAYAFKRSGDEDRRFEFYREGHPSSHVPTNS